MAKCDEELHTARNAESAEKLMSPQALKQWRIQDGAFGANAPPPPK